MSSPLMIHTCFVLEFALAPAPDMDTRRQYRRRVGKNAQTGAAEKHPVPCRFSELGSHERFLAGLRGSQVTHRVYFDANPMLTEANRLEWRGAQYIIDGVPVNPSGANRLWYCDAYLFTQQNEQLSVVEVGKT